MKFQSRQRVVTFAEITDENGKVVGMGEAILSPDDENSPETGEAIALGRAAKDMIQQAKGRVWSDPAIAKLDVSLGTSPKRRVVTTENERGGTDWLLVGEDAYPFSKGSGSAQEWVTGALKYENPASGLFPLQSDNSRYVGESKQEIDGFRVGDRVKHNTGNVGTIIGLEKGRDGGEIVIQYDEDQVLAGRPLGAQPKNLTHLGRFKAPEVVPETQTTYNASQAAPAASIGRELPSYELRPEFEVGDRVEERDQDYHDLAYGRGTVIKVNNDGYVVLKFDKGVQESSPRPPSSLIRTNLKPGDKVEWAGNHIFPGTPLDQGTVLFKELKGREQYMVRWDSLVGVDAHKTAPQISYASDLLRRIKEYSFTTPVRGENSSASASV